VAVGASGYVTVWNGTAWSTPTDADSTRTMDAVSCTSSTFCAAVDTSGYATIYNGTTWSTPSDIDATRSVDAVSCTSSTFCVAVGASGYAAVYSGSWAAASDVDSTRTMDAVSCTSSTFCEAADESGYAAKYTGAWGTATDIDSTRNIDALSCQSSSLCFAADTVGYVAKYTTSWATATDVDSSRSIKRLVCPSSTMCVLIDTTGYATTYNGTSWATPVDVDNAANLDALSCASTTYCLAGDTVGDVVTYNGTSWSLPLDVDMSHSISAVACPTSSFCAAVDGSGYVAMPTAVSEGGPTTAQLTWDLTSGLPLVLSDSNFDYIYGPNTTPVEAISLTSSTPTYLAYSSGADTWVATNETGDLVGFWGYDAYGNLAFGTPETAFGYAGQYTDAFSGLSDMRARYYQSQTGQFNTRDPLYDQTDVAYGYANSDPVNGADPMGLCNSGVVNGYYPGPCATTAQQAEKAGAYIESHISGGGFSIANGLKAVADYGAGIANAAISTVTFGSVHISSPYCGFGWASDVGGVYFNVSLGILSIGQASEIEIGEVTAESTEATAASRVQQLHDALDPIAQNSRTSAVLTTQEGVDVLASGGRDLAPVQRAMANEGDLLARLPGAHAEITALDAASKAGLTPSELAVSRLICTDCQAFIENSGGTISPNGMGATWP
jgi:RHS repeat-associated protein